MEYTRDLGYCAAKYLLSGGNGGHDLDAGRPPRADPVRASWSTGDGPHRRCGMVDMHSTRYAIARRYMIRLRRDDFDDAARAGQGSRPPRVSTSTSSAGVPVLVEDEPPGLVVSLGEAEPGRAPTRTRDRAAHRRTCGCGRGHRSHQRRLPGRALLRRRRPHERRRGAEAHGERHVPGRGAGRRPPSAASTPSSAATAATSACSAVDPARHGKGVGRTPDRGAAEARFLRAGAGRWTSASWTCARSCRPLYRRLGYVENGDRAFPDPDKRDAALPLHPGCPSR